MIIHDFDNSTAPIVNIEHFYGKPKKIVEKCLILFSKVIHDYLLSHYDCKVIGELGACNGNINIWSFTHNGEQIAFYLSGIGSAIASGSCYEAHWLTGAAKFVMFGSCGSLDREKTFGRFIIPTECYRGDGCSYYYAPPSDYLTVRNGEKLAALFDELGVPYVKGRTWTTDSMLRETAGLVQKRKSEGCLAVEMELAGVEALCAFYGLELYDFLEAGDVLEESGYDIKGLSGANHNLGKLFIALEIVKRI
ncbi:MAG: nucleoside phosphorylase [Clostridia bacterium]|nr:nucleoside phosphorylase [Clostridia bacterium]